MAYDEELADRVRELVEHEPGLTEKRMFGGLAFMLNGRLAVAAGSNGDLMLRVDPADTDRLLQEPPTSPVEMRGREMKGWINVDANAIGADDELARWIGLGVAYAKSLPPK